MTLRPNSVVERVLDDPATHRVTGVRVIDAVSMREVDFRARVVFLCASTLESTRRLLNSRTRDFPAGLANSSGELGHNLMDHTMGQGARGVILGLEDRTYHGNRPNGGYIPRFRNVRTKHAAFVRGYAYQGEAYRQGWERSGAGFGTEFKRSLTTEQGPWVTSLEGYGEICDV